MLTGGIFGLVLYCRRKKLPVLRVLGCTALAFPVAQIIGKFANIINGDTWVGIPLYARPRLKIDGMAFLLYLSLYSLGRFFVSFFRVNKIIVLGLREAQIIALAVIVLAIPAALYLRHRAMRTQHIQPPDERAVPG